MLKFLIYFVIFLGQNQALDVQDYTEFVDDLNNNVKFIDEYTKWSSKLFAQPNYLYGDVHPKSPCPSDYEVDDDGTPESVHQLRPQDINCIAALGDSFTTGLNAHATTPADLLLEHRGSIHFELSSIEIDLSFRDIMVDWRRLYLFANANISKCIEKIQSTIKRFFFATT